MILVDGYVMIKVIKVGDDMIFVKIIELVEEV